ncbi:hypothetical protein [Paracoccus shanxieyensis]|uniref:Protein ImuA n=1 Tax=Paracoccus shanxieyensis TaxID=2675752 RepID=A0A6L6IYT6_9RHOB|nr:hypothetical protein [Paracoccus shanxieyensis]MTH65393.1 hypothetical protein [Paracoccus shanxieyensis]MTH88538.1 hypothetical protein [Paracoccus shanxieyensis]
MHANPFPLGVAPSGRTPAPSLILPTLSEAFGQRPLDGAAIGFVRAALPPGPVLWVQDRLSRAEYGAPCLAGMGRALIRLDLTRPADVLTALEDGLQSHALAAVVGEIHGMPQALSFTASRRLALRAERGGLPCWLIRHAAPAADASAARMRWRLGVLPSDRDPDDPQAPGDPQWRAELFRVRGAAPSLWQARHDRAADRLDLVAVPGDRALAQTPRRGVA